MITRRGGRESGRGAREYGILRGMGEEIRYYRRYHGYDYSRGAALFITMATEPRRALFGRVENAVVVLSDFGRQVLECIEAIPSLNPGISLFEHVLMPDHLHMNLRIAPGLAEPLQVLGAAMRRFKSYTTTLARRQLGLSTIWQQGYHDRICVSRRFIEAVTRYIRYNPLKYELMYNQPKYMRIREPLDSPRLDIEDFWKGVGNVALLDEANKLLALRVSRKVQTRDISQVVARMEDAVNAGYTLISGFISPGEVAVRDMLLENREARFIHILPSCMKNGHRPDSRYLPTLSEGRFLEIAKGNDEIAAIAKAGEGGVLYWRDEGPRFERGLRQAEHPA